MLDGAIITIYPDWQNSGKEHLDYLLWWNGIYYGIEIRSDNK